MAPLFWVCPPMSTHTRREAAFAPGAVCAQMPQLAWYLRSRRHELPTHFLVHFRSRSRGFRGPPCPCSHRGRRGDRLRRLQRRELGLRTALPSQLRRRRRPRERPPGPAGAAAGACPVVAPAGRSCGCRRQRTAGRRCAGCAGHHRRIAPRRRRFARSRGRL